MDGPKKKFFFGLLKFSLYKISQKTIFEVSMFIIIAKMTKFVRKLQFLGQLTSLLNTSEHLRALQTDLPITFPKIFSPPNFLKYFDFSKKQYYIWGNFYKYLNKLGFLT